jgi:hypothetical protein
MCTTVVNYTKSFKEYAKNTGVSDVTNQNIVVVVPYLQYNSDCCTRKLYRTNLSGKGCNYQLLTCIR